MNFNRKKFTIDSFSQDLDQVLLIDDSVFVANNKDTQKLYNLILSLTHFFNNLRDTVIFSQFIDSGLIGVKKTSNQRFGQLSGMKIFVDNLFFAFLLEFIQLFKDKNNKKIIQGERFSKIIGLIGQRTKDDWKKLLTIVYDSDDKIYTVLLKLRNNLSFHYYQPTKLFEGYFSAIKNPNNKMYVSSGSTMSSTRYYFCDLANQLAIYNIIQEDFTLTDWKKERDNLVHLILSVTMNVVDKFIISRAAPSAAKEEKIQHIKEYLK